MRLRCILGLFGAAVLGTSSLCGCARQHATAAAMPSVSSATLTSAPIVSTPLTDAQIARAAAILERGLDDQAQIAASSSSAPLQRLSARVGADVVQGAPGEPSVLADAIASDVTATNGELRARQGDPDFAREYVGRERIALESSLRLIDGTLLPAVGNDSLRQQLQTLRGRIDGQLRALDDAERTLPRTLRAER